MLDEASNSPVADRAAGAQGCYPATEFAKTRYSSSLAITSGGEPDGRYRMARAKPASARATSVSASAGALNNPTSIVRGSRPAAVAAPPELGQFPVDVVQAFNGHPAVAEFHDVTHGSRSGVSTEDDRRVRLLDGLGPGPTGLERQVPAMERRKTLVLSWPNRARWGDVAKLKLRNRFFRRPQNPVATPATASRANSQLQRPPDSSLWAAR